MTTLTALEDCFTTHIDWMRKVTEMNFRQFDPDRREEAVQNTLCLAWKFFHRLFHQGRANPGILKSVLWYAIRQTKSKRTIQGTSRSKDALQYRERGRVKFEQTDLDGLIGRSTPVPEQVSFRMDVPAFLSTLTTRQRIMAHELAVGMTTSEVAKRHGVTPGAVSQFRKRFKDYYDAFFAEE